MRLFSISATLAAFLFAGSVLGQSLSDVAKKEKERRKKNDQQSGQVQVITENELQQGRRESPPSEDPAETGATSQGPSSRSRTTSSRPPTGQPAEEGGAPTEIPGDAPIRDKIAIFERMLTAHRAEVAKMDDEIAENNTRIEAIEQELTSIGAAGLPIAPQVDQQVRNPADALGLRAEQNELRQKNQQLEAQKRKSAEELRSKGRRAGIPSGYLRF